MAVEPHGDGIANVVYRDDDGRVADRLVTAADADRCEVVQARRWTFDADGMAFKLASEARRIQLAHLFDPYAAVQSATINPLPHQIEAVYGRLLPVQPLHFLLAGDPGHHLAPGPPVRRREPPGAHRPQVGGGGATHHDLRRHPGADGSRPDPAVERPA